MKFCIPNCVEKGSCGTGTTTPGGSQQTTPVDIGNTVRSIKIDCCMYIDDLKLCHSVSSAYKSSVCRFVSSQTTYLQLGIKSRYTV